MQFHSGVNGLKENILLNFEFKNEATRANLQENKRILKWRPFWNKCVNKKLEAMETKLDNLGNFVKNVEAKVNALTTKVETLEATTRNAMKSIEELDKGLAFLNSESEVEGLKKLEKDCAALRQQVLYM